MWVLAGQKWSIDFIIFLCRKTQMSGLKFRVYETDGRIIEITSDSVPNRDYEREERVLRQDEWDYLLGLKR